MLFHSEATFVCNDVPIQGKDCPQSLDLCDGDTIVAVPLAKNVSSSSQSIPISSARLVNAGHYLIHDRMNEGMGRGERCQNQTEKKGPYDCDVDDLSWLIGIPQVVVEWEPVCISK